MQKRVLPDSLALSAACSASYLEYVAILRSAAGGCLCACKGGSCRRAQQAGCWCADKSELHCMASDMLCALLLAAPHGCLTCLGTEPACIRFRMLPGSQRAEFARSMMSHDEPAILMPCVW